MQEAMELVCGGPCSLTLCHLEHLGRGEALPVHQRRRPDGGIARPHISFAPTEDGRGYLVGCKCGARHRLYPDRLGRIYEAAIKSGSRQAFARRTVATSSAGKNRR